MGRERSEWRETALWCLLLFSVTAAFVLLKSARDALFLSRYPARILPYYMGLSTVASSVITLIYLRVCDRVGLRRAVWLFSVVFIGGTFAQYPVLRHNLPGAIVSLYVWTAIVGTLSPVQAWSLVTDRLGIRQARRVVGTIGAGAVTGGIAGGLLAGWATRLWGVLSLLPAGGALLLVPLFILYAAKGKGGASQPGQSRDAETAEIQPGTRFVVLTVLVISLVTIVSTFAAFQFRMVTQQRFHGADDLAVFFGSFYTYTGALTLLFQLAVSGYLMKTLSLAATLSVLPIALTAANVYVMLSGSLASVVLLSGSERLFGFSIDRSSREVLYMAMAGKVKLRVKSLVDAVGVRFSEALGSLILILFVAVAGFSWKMIAPASAALAGGAVVCAWLLGSDYARTLKNSVQRNVADFSSVLSSVLTSDFYRLIPEMLANSGKEVILELLDLFSRKAKASPHLTALLKHADPEIRQKAIEVLGTVTEDLSHHVAPLLADPDRRVMLEAFRYLSNRQASVAIETLEQLEPAIADPSLGAGRLSDAGLRRLVDPELASPEERMEIAGRIGFLPASSRACAVLYPVLLNDVSADVRRAALRSVAVNKPQAAVPAIMDQLLSGNLLVTELQRALADYGTRILPEIQRRIQKRETSPRQNKLLIRLIQMSGGSESAEVIFPLAQSADIDVRYHALSALNRLKRKSALTIDASRLNDLLGQEQVAVEIEHERIGLIAPRSGGVLEQVLRQRREWAVGRLFGVLQLVYDSAAIRTAHLAFSSGDRRNAERGLELLSAVASGEHRRTLLRLLETPSQPGKAVRTDARRSLLFGYLGAKDELPAAALISELSGEEVAGWRQDIEQALQVFSGMALVEETWQWRLQQMGNHDSGQSRSRTVLERMEILKTVDVFSSLGAQELLVVADGCAETEFPAGEMMIRQGEPARCCFLLVTGKARLTRGASAMGDIGVGDSVGIFEMVGGLPYFYSCACKEPCLCLSIEREPFLDLVDQNPGIAAGIFPVVGRQIEKLLQKLEQK